LEIPNTQTEQILGFLNEGDEETKSCSLPLTYAVVIRGNTAGYIVNPPPTVHTKS
jgi:hypothetical protein